MAGKQLTQDFDAHVLFTSAEIPDRPFYANRWARTRRWFTIAFVESWLAVWLFRLKVRLRAAGLPALPGLCDMLSRTLFGVQIGNRVEAGPGLMITHGNVVIDGCTKIGRRCQINPWVTIGLSNSKKLGFSIDGPTIGDYVHIGTGAKILGPITIGDYARIGANAVVVHDVPANATVVGVPARVVGGIADSGATGDAELVARMRSEIVEYRLHRQSLESLVKALAASLDAGSDGLRAARESVKDDLIFLDAVAATGGEETAQVRAAVEAIDAALTGAG